MVNPTPTMRMQKATQAKRPGKMRERAFFEEGERPRIGDKTAGDKQAADHEEDIYGEFAECQSVSVNAKKWLARAVTAADRVAVGTDDQQRRLEAESNRNY